MALFNLGMGEITVILLLALIFLGPKKLPELASGLGKLIREIRKTTSDMKNEIQLDEAIRKPLEELREAVTLHPEELKRRDRVRRDLAELQKQADELAKNSPVAPDGASDAATADENAQGQGPSATAEAATHAGPDTHASGISGPHAVANAGGHAPAQAPAQGAEASATSTPEYQSAASTPPPSPHVTGAAPSGTVARESSGPAAPPAPPLAALSAKGSGPISVPDRRLPGPSSSGSDFVRQLRNIPEGKRPTPAAEPAPVVSAADRGNITQALSEADLAAITVGPPPPPPGRQVGRNVTPPPPPPTSNLPGATPPKKPEPMT